ncbi:MAG: hypothetical protein Q4E42_05835, partial [Phascolarctobacterium sp.]|nr:hypothetical protein [Phascolarctobacterium sp.]
MKFKAKSMLAMAVLLSVMSVGTMAEAEWRYKVDDGVEQIWDGSSDLIGSSNKLEVWSSTGSDLSGKFICGSYDGHSKTVIFKSGLVSSVYGGKTNASIVVGNTVNISGGYVGVGVYGGYCDNNCDAIGNTVIISNGTLTGDVYGGYSFLGGQVYGNKVIISGGNLSDAKVYGGNGLSFSNDNTLQIENSVTVNKIGNFENISFVLPSISGDKTLLSLTNAFSMTGENVRVNLGYNTNSTLNSYNVTLANNVSGAFDVTYYDKDGAGYVEEFSIASAGDLKIGEGTKMRVGYDLTTDAGELLGKQDTLYVDSGIKLTFASGTLEKNIAGTGTTEFNNTVSVANDVNLGTSTNNVNDTLDVLEHITTGNINFKNGSTLKVDGTKIISAAAITGITSATVESGAKLYVSNAEKDTPYKILSGSGINVSGWQTDVEMDDVFRAIYGLVADTDNITNNSNEFTIQFKMDPSVFDKLDIPNVFVHKPMGSTLQKFVENISLSNPYKSATVINTMANMNSLANVQQGTQAVMTMATDALQTNIGTGARPLLGHRAEGVGRNSGVRGQVSGVRKVSANDKDRAAIETVEQGKRDEVMPVMVENEEQKYDKTVWANYIHSKKTIDGLKTGRLTQN